MNETTLRTLRGETARERMLHRLHCVVLVLQGHSAKHVAEWFGDSPRAIAYWVGQFKTSGNVEEKKRAGRTPRLNVSQLSQLREFVAQRDKHGQGTNADELSKHIARSFGISHTKRQCWRILKQLRSKVFLS